MNKIAILYTTFLRDELIYKTIPHILENMSNKDCLFIADQGEQSEEKDNFYNSLPKSKVKQWYLPYDCGLSYARNFLVNKAKSMFFDYCLLTSDSIKIKTSLSELDFAFEFLKSNKDYGIIGLKINNRISWEKLIRLDEKENKFIIKNATETIEFLDEKFLRCDIVRNFFIAKIDALLSVGWDNDLKLGEHEDFFWRLKIKTFWKVFYTDSYEGDYIICRPEKYQQLRKRMYKDYIPLLLKKYKLKEWIRDER